MTDRTDRGGDAVRGRVEDGYEPLAEAFARVVEAQPRSVGQQLAMYHHGRRVVDLWAGPGVDGDALTGAFSVSKGAAHLVVALLVQRGVLELDRPVASYWPEFGQGGKEQITLRQVLAHQAGVIGVDEEFTADELADDALLARRLAPQVPYWRPGTAFGYHGLVIAALTGEVVRQATGRGLQHWWEHEMRRPHQADFYLGLPASHEGRYLPVLPAEPGSTAPPDAPRDAAGQGEAAERTLNDIAFSTRYLPELWVFPNARRTRELGQGSAGGVASARGIAAVYAATTSGLAGQQPLLTPRTLAAFAEVHSEGVDLVTGTENRFALGFQVYDKDHPALPAGALGHAGATGSLGLAVPSHQLGYAYVRRQFAAEGVAERENALLLDALVRCL